MYVFLCLINPWAFPLYVLSPSSANPILFSHAQDGSEFALFQKDPNSLWIWDAIILSNDNDIAANGAFIDCIAMVSLAGLTSPCEIPLHKVLEISFLYNLPHFVVPSWYLSDFFLQIFNWTSGAVIRCLRACAEVSCFGQRTDLSGCSH